MHWSIIGGRFIVHVYPDTLNGPGYYVNGTAGGIKNLRSIEQCVKCAIKAALGIAGGGYVAAWRGR